MAVSRVVAVSIASHRSLCGNLSSKSTLTLVIFCLPINLCALKVVFLQNDFAFGLNCFEPIVLNCDWRVKLPSDLVFWYSLWIILTGAYGK